MRGQVLVALLVITLSGCGFVAELLPGGAEGPGVGGPMDVERVGPRIVLGSVPTVGDPARDQGEMVFFQTEDGWCTEFGSGMGCSGGGGMQVPEGFSGVGGTEGPEGTCIEAITGKDVVRIEASPRTAPSVVLAPLPGSAEAPVNGFAVCWADRVAFDDVHVRAFDADGDPVPGP